MSIESKLTKILEKGGKHPLFPLLRALSFGYGAVQELRSLAYDRGWLRSLELEVPVISVGSIVAGGTGKTPFVALLASELEQFGEIAVLLRGYRAEGADRGEVIPVHALLPSERDVRRCGDEALLLQRKLSLSRVWVAKKREKAAVLAIKEGAELLILDDGMQRRSLGRDIELALLDGRDLFGKNFILPRGFLREKPKALRRADWVIVSYIEGEERYREVQKSLLPYTDAPVIALKRELLTPVPLAGEPIGVLAAIARPSRFEESLTKEGAKIVSRFWKDDHRLFESEELLIAADLARKKGAKFLVCSEKDGVKLPALSLPLPLVIVGEKLSIFSGQAHWRDLLQRSRELIEKVRI